MIRTAVTTLMFTIVVTGCRDHSKGDRFTLKDETDSLLYVVAVAGNGTKLSKKAARMKLEHDRKGNKCEIRYLTDSTLLNSKKGILLFNSALPSMDKDFLSKGFFGTFTSKQIVTCLLVSDEEVDKYFVKKE